MLGCYKGIDPYGARQRSARKGTCRKFDERKDLHPQSFYLFSSLQKIESQNTRKNGATSAALS
ncbi:MAG: hypothetical protein SRB2_01716 [Desulfobacteraceae bacterium Eth-SRB2]|nr:MAG: hypothetical protein SRB2_01716 [Desulfobacteraceae bacterium Eth-SRB2]